MLAGEDTTMIGSYLYLLSSGFFFVAVGVFWIFVLWMLWIICKSLKGIDQSLKEIARGQQNKS
jgi:ABC-type spermidine/putrescine transport system permease subunit I